MALEARIETALAGADPLAGDGPHGQENIPAQQRAIRDDPLVPAAARIGMLVLALSVSAWFGLGWYQASKTGQATALVSGRARLTTHQAQRAQSLLSSAGTLNPDRTVRILRGELAADQH